MPLGSATVDKHTSLMVWVFSKEGKCDKEADLRKLSDSFVSCLYYSLTNPKDGDGGGEEKGEEGEEEGEEGEGEEEKAVRLALPNQHDETTTEG